MVLDHCIVFKGGRVLVEILDNLLKFWILLNLIMNLTLIYPLWKGNHL